MKIFILFWIVLSPVTVLAATQASPRSSIEKITSYATEGGGDIIVELVDNGSQCSSGYWLKKTDPGFHANYMMLITAFQSQLNSVIIEGNSYDLRSGSSSGIYCRVASVQYSNG